MAIVRKWFRRKLLLWELSHRRKKNSRKCRQARQNQQPNPNDVFLAASAEKVQADAMKSTDGSAT